MKRMRSNLLRIEAVVIAVIMTISMFGSVNVNAAEIRGENGVSVATEETVELDANIENSNVEMLTEFEKDDEDFEEEIEITGTDEASEISLMYVDESEYLIQAGGFGIYDEALGANDVCVQDAIYSGLKAQSAEIDIRKYGILTKNIGALFRSVIDAHPDLYYVDAEFQYEYSGTTFEVSRIMPAYNIECYDLLAFDRAVENAMSVVNTDMSDLEKAIALHDYLALNVAYNKDVAAGAEAPAGSPVFSAYGALVNQDAVCQGYALAYEYLLGLADIECGLVTSNAMCHAWNYVKIDDQYYNVDVTWDDGFVGDFGDIVGYVCHNNMFKSDINFNRTPANDNEQTHQADDWAITINGIPTTTKSARDTSYDNFYWDDAYSQFVWGDDGKVFYEYRDIDEEGCLLERSIKKAKIDGTQSEVFFEPRTINAESFGLFSIGDRLYYSSGNDIVGVKMSNSSQKMPLNIPRTVTGTALCYNVQSDSYEVKYQSGTDRYVLSLADVADIEEYNVRFLDENENVIAVKKVQKGKDAVAPELPDRKGYTSKWDKSFANVQADMDVKASYTPIDYSITYNLVKAGAVNNPENPATYNVESAFEFKNPSLEGYEFVAWYQDVEYKTIPLKKIDKGTTEDIVLFAKWIPKKPAAPVIKAEPSQVLENGNILVDAGTEITIESEVGTKICYTLDDSNPTASSKVYTGGFVVNDKTVVKAVAIRETALGPVASNTFVTANNEFKLQGDMSLLVGDSRQIFAVTLPTTKSVGDIESFVSSDTNVVTVDDSGVITAVGEGTATIKATITDWKGNSLQDSFDVEVGAQTYYVTFVGYDGNVIEIQPVLGGRSAEEPGMSIGSRTPEGYSFLTWDKSFDAIIKDITVKAVFEPETYTISFVNKEGIAPEDIQFKITSDTFSLPDSSHMPVLADKDFGGWFIDEDCTGNPVSIIPSGTIGDRTLYAKWNPKETLTMEWDSSVPITGGVAYLPYTGTAQTPAFTVYFAGKPLENKKDYTYKFANNVNAYILDENDESLYAKKAPVLIITGKGNYAGTERVYFNITRKSIENPDVDIVPVSLAYNKKVQKVAPVVTWKGKKLTTKELTFEYDSVEDGAYINVGEYNVKVSGKGNYEGDQNVTLKIFNTSVTEENPSVLIKSCKVSITPFVFDENAIDFTDSEIRSHIKVTRGKNPVPYYNDPETDGNGYDIKLIGVPEAKDIGTYTVCISGKGIYKGELRTTFKINGLNVSTMKVTPIPAEIYDGAAKKPKLVIYAKTGEVLNALDDEGNGDYELVYQKNVDVGTATVVITGKNAYFGTRKVTFKINQKVMAADSVDWSKIKVTLLGTNDPEDVDCIEYDYVKGGVTPKLNVEYSYIDEFGKPAKKELMEKTDYTLAYKNNNTATPASGKEPYVVLTLKKNIKGTMNIPFVISKKQLNGLTIKVSDIQANAQAGKYKSTPAIYDVNDKKLDSKDYETAFVYTYQGSDTPLDKYSKPEAGKVIKVTVTGKGNYTGSITGTYRVFAKGKSIAAASIKIKPDVLAELKYNNGQPVVLKETDLEVKMGKTVVLNPYDDYVIDATSYVNNTNKGTAKVTIIGKGDYAGSKTISFSIKPWYLKWWIF